MTVQAQNSTQYYEGPIAVDTVLSITEFTFIDNSHVSAKVRGESSTWEYGVDYLVAGANTLNRTLTVKKAVPEGSVLAIYLDVPITQGISPEEGGNFPASTNEFVLDKLTYICQMLDERLKRSLQISIDTPFSGTLPQPEPNKALKINAEGNGFVMSDYDPDTALVTTEGFKNQAQAAAQAAANSQAKALESANNSASSATQAQAIVDNGQVSINSTVAQGESTIASAVATGQQNITNIGNTAASTINQAVDEFKTYMNENPFSGKTIGEISYTNRVTAANGQYFCNGQEFSMELFSGDQSIVNLLANSIIPSVSYEDYQLILQYNNNNVCEFFGVDWINRKFKVPTLPDIYRDKLVGDEQSVLKAIVQLATSATEVSFADYATQFTNALNQAMNTLSSSGQEYLQDLTPNKFVEFADRRKIKIAKNTFLRLDTVTKNYTVVGSPTITEDGIASGFSEDNYIYSELPVSVTLDKVDIWGKFYTKMGSNTQNIVFTLTSELLPSLSNIVLQLSYFPVNNRVSLSGHNNDSWTGWYAENNSIEPNTNYLFHAYFNKINNTINLDLSTDGKTYTNVIKENITVNSTYEADKLFVGSIRQSGNYCEGSIDLKHFSITVDGKEVYRPQVGPLWFVNTEDQIIEAESLLDEGSVFQNGKNYALYLVPNETYTGVELKVSLNQTAPNGYSPLDTRRIAGWHTECADVGTVTWDSNHLLSGWLAGDILPQSVWTLYHRPYAPPAAGVVYVECGRPFWRTIYDHSGTLETTNFEYGGTITRNRTFYGHFKDMAAVGFSLPTYEQAALSGIGCEELKAVMGKAESSITTAGGHINESSHRIVSRVGAEDCVGCTWKPTTIAAIGGSGWNTDASVGVHQYGNVQLLHVGGSWVDSGSAGPLATTGDCSALSVNAHVASFGVSYPLPRKAVGIDT